MYLIDEEFPLLEKCIYLNSTGVGVIPRSVLTSIQEFQSSGLSRPPYPDLMEEWMVMAEEVRGEFARYIGADTAEVSFQQNVSIGCNLVTEMLDFKPGENVVIDDLHFPSTIYPVMALQKKGVEVRVLKNRRDEVEVSQYEEAVDDKTRLVSVSLVSWVNGFRSPIESIGRLCREKGSLFHVDSSHATGYIGIDVGSVDVDFLVTCNYKWLLAPLGAAEMYVRRDVLERVDSPHKGWNSVMDRVEDIQRPGYRPTQDARKFEPGNPDYAAIYGLKEALRFLEKVGMETISGRSRELVGRAMDGLRQLGFGIHTPIDPAKHGNPFFCTLNGVSGKALSDYLRERGIVVSARRYGELSGLRVSPYFYNSEEEVDSFLQAVKDARMAQLSGP